MPLGLRLEGEESQAVKNSTCYDKASNINKDYYLGRQVLEDKISSLQKQTDTRKTKLRPGQSEIIGKKAATAQRGQ
jgi:hypothetical protein